MCMGRNLFFHVQTYLKNESHLFYIICPKKEMFIIKRKHVFVDLEINQGYNY